MCVDRAVLLEQDASALSPPYTTWYSDCSAAMVTNLLFIFLSECDVGSSKTVVNGLVPGSHGQDKGKAIEGKPGLVSESISRRCRTCWAGAIPTFLGNTSLALS